MSNEMQSPHSELENRGKAAPLEEERLLALVDSISIDLDRAVQIAGSIGPEWENVVDDIRGPVRDQLADLAHRLSARLARRPRS